MPQKHAVFVDTAVMLDMQSPGYSVRHGKNVFTYACKSTAKKNGTTKYWGDILDIKNHRNQRADISAMKNLILLPML